MSDPRSLAMQPRTFVNRSTLGETCLVAKLPSLWRLGFAELSKKPSESQRSRAGTR